MLATAEDGLHCSRMFRSQKMLYIKIGYTISYLMYIMRIRLSFYLKVHISTIPKQRKKTHGQRFVSHPSLPHNHFLTSCTIAVLYDPRMNQHPLVIHMSEKMDTV